MKTNISIPDSGSNRSSDEVHVSAKINANTVINPLKQKGGFKNLKYPIIYLSGILSCLLVLITFTFTSMGCEKPENKQTNVDTISHTLKGTTWKLVGFVGVSNKTTIIEAEPKDCENCYVLTFVNDSIFDGTGVCNIMNGYYYINSPSIKVVFGSMTEVVSWFDEELYVNTMNQVESYFQTENELKMYYNNHQNYLLFKSIDK
jgi:hypothetical protein